MLPLQLATPHLILTATPCPPPLRPRVLVLAARIEDVDAVVAEYQGLMAALPDAGLTAEGIHSKRFTFYETPVNTAANVIVGTTAKLANILRCGGGAGAGAALTAWDPLKGGGGGALLWPVSEVYCSVQ